ncbi:hypothetical protein VOLCADRAFT_86293 [Volvox carteri f. nagariensis]|uniref:Uncharacterized protein n=1 Tax=Volvox carteri f. nagariensis TaxID=3068 RepID=D8TIE3_VOLCA|nr:uncharacterized protein VOLCADRAFT_86293 [Volvox carteri f. nagariensis]EFJ52876.1 hypothetical protein VOLCADRAFT_86293 [Volvox carteri f. nagariensis]|eukprot:XP_002945881.1 hypothetical protein VOLCADRAFT_86293 [Volvox carteri f. nagariensis]
MTRNIRHIIYDVSKIARSSVASDIVPRPAAGFYAAWKALRICIALLLIQGHNGFNACRGSTMAHFVSGAGSSRLGQHRHGRLLVSSSGVANVSDGSLFVAALRDPAVKRIVLTSPLVDVPPDTWEAVGGNLPIPITRNLTLEGDEADWPLLRLHYVTDVVRLMDTVILAIRFLFLDGANGGNNHRDQGKLPVALLA